MNDNVIKKSFKKIIYFIILIASNRVVEYLLDKFGFLLNYAYCVYVGIKIEKHDGGIMLEYPIILKGGEYITIGRNFSTRARFRNEVWDFYRGHKYNPSILIGDNVLFNFNCYIGAINKIEIGNNVLVGSNVLITDHSHGQINSEALENIPVDRPLYSKGPVIIEDNVWIGEGVAILPNVKIGKNSIIGANSVVTHSMPSNSVVAGNPAKIIKSL